MDLFFRKEPGKIGADSLDVLDGRIQARLFSLSVGKEASQARLGFFGRRRGRRFFFWCLDRPASPERSSEGGAEGELAAGTLSRNFRSSLS